MGHRQRASYVERRGFLYTSLISHSGRRLRALWTGIGWYRKHFKLPASGKGGKSSS